MTVELDEARAEYAQWFVKQHYLRKQRPYTGSVGLGIDGPSRWRAAERQGYIRYYTQQNLPCKDSKGEVLIDAYQSEGDEFDTDYMMSMWSDQPEKYWWRIDIEDVDDPINDGNTIIQRYRMYREASMQLTLWEWLMAEAEYHVVTFEAWLRAYGADPSAFPAEVSS